MSSAYETWMKSVEEALSSVNMPMVEWQSRWPFDFQAEYEAGTSSDEAAMRANRFWWREQNKALRRDCRSTHGCWLPRGHQGACEVSDSKGLPHTRPPGYQPGDFVKVEFPDEVTGIGEWMWVRITRCDNEKQLVFGVLDNEPLSDYQEKVELGTELAVHYSQIRDHKKPIEFTKQ